VPYLKNLQNYIAICFLAWIYNFVSLPKGKIPSEDAIEDGAE